MTEQLQPKNNTHKIYQAPSFDEFSWKSDKVVVKSLSPSQRQITVSNMPESHIKLLEDIYQSGNKNVQSSIKSSEMLENNLEQKVKQDLQGLVFLQGQNQESLRKKEDKKNWNNQSPQSLLKKSQNNKQVVGLNSNDTRTVSIQMQHQQSNSNYSKKVPDSFQLKLQKINTNDTENINHKSKQVIGFSSKQKVTQNDSPPISPTMPHKQPITESQCCLQVTNKRWEDVLLKITKTKLHLGPIVMEFEQVLKVKIFPAEKHQDKLCFGGSGNQGFLDGFRRCKKVILKVTTPDNNTFQFSQVFSNSSLSKSLQSQNEKSAFPLPFQTFSRIIIRKLRLLYPSTKSTDWQAPSTSSFGININTKQSYIHGNIYKKSQHKGNWQKRFIIVNDTGVYSYKNEKKQNHTFFIERSDIKYMWTWFTTLKGDISRMRLSEENTVQKCKQLETNRLSEGEDNQNSYLIVKLKHGFNGQTQFGIPICGFDNEANKNKNWLWAFFMVLPHYEK